MLINEKHSFWQELENEKYHDKKKEKGINAEDQDQT